jgi:hypothetical protein
MKARRPEGERSLLPVQSGIEPAGAALCWSAFCRHCGRGYISCVRPFPARYSCPACVERLGLHKEWLAAHPCCRNGHRLSEGMVAWDTYGPGQHGCRVCIRIRGRQRREARREQKRLGP